MKEISVSGSGIDENSSVSGSGIDEKSPWKLNLD